MHPENIHPLADIDPNCIIGNRTKVWRFTHIDKGAFIGEDCSIGQGCYIKGYVGNGCKIQNHVSIFRGVHIEDNVFIAEGVSFTNVKRPRAAIKTEAFEPTIVMHGATIGANSTIVCGVTLGEFCFVGAGSVVTKNVPPFAMIVGNPARRIGSVCRCGEKLKLDLPCGYCMDCQSEREKNEDG